MNVPLLTTFRDRHVRSFGTTTPATVLNSRYRGLPVQPTTAICKRARRPDDS
ncbi:hypothetical protein CC1G_06198 [Coprinopsis cinerea okayama7|uniref:Uncharacterized protein n=1 Tax=Coprinopsis cinerea (strain Okayama-7 / 130 / ATCC MYA-4618 / FGSC 9003) TaxID=240176 RepID=A8NV67_COPC7|nr:hypothetical protein CC1G_06198 [Coprinopsis cinerea okayama7\|eukprot:XP_001836611.2 hypothetical protein CC1G_06198 [Coprinopsis cinerea okayama7\